MSSSHGDNIIIFKPKMQNKYVTKNIEDSNSCGDKVIVFNLDNADKICAAQKFMLKVHMGT